MFVDIHTHILPPSGTVAIRNLSLADVEKVLIPEGNGFFSAGLHPWYTDDFTAENFAFLEVLFIDKRLVAIGECGMDKNSKVALSHQLFVFEKHIALSEKIRKPLIIHCVGCYNEIFELKKKLQPQQLWIFHGFRGKPELAKQALNAGCSLSYGEHFNRESVRITPVDQLYIETDESTIAIDEIYARISNIKNCKAEELTAGMNLIQSFAL